MNARKDTEQVARYADMFAAMGAEPRLRIMQLLLTAHPQGLVVGDIQEELSIPASTLSHHLDKLKNEDLVQVRREGTYLWYAANTEALQEISISCMRSAAHVTRRFSPVSWLWCAPPGDRKRGGKDESIESEGSRKGEVRRGGAARDTEPGESIVLRLRRWEWHSSGRPHNARALRRYGDFGAPCRSRPGVARLRQSGGVGRASAGGDGARSGLRWRHRCTAVGQAGGSDREGVWPGHDR